MIRYSLWFALVFSFVAISASPAADSPSMLSILPAGGCGEGWVMEEKPALFTVDTLFDHINGEAELYLPVRIRQPRDGPIREEGNVGLAVRGGRLQDGLPS